MVVAAPGFPGVPIQVRRRRLFVHDRSQTVVEDHVVVDVDEGRPTVRVGADRVATVCDEIWVAVLMLVCWVVIDRFFGRRNS